MRIGLFAPPTRPAAVQLAREAAALLLSSGAAVAAETVLGLPGCADMAAASDLDALICIGGDGTLLHAVPFAVAHHAPVLGINMGYLGFLAETPPDRLADALRCLLSGDFRVEERPLLSVCVDDAPGRTYLALNDLVLLRGIYPRLVSATVSADGEEIERVRADGLIVATPTGSTGYALSSGGPIVAPGTDCVLLSAVCAHSLTHRPAILPGASRLRVTLSGDDLMRVVLQTDGQTQRELCNGLSVCVSRSGERLRLIHTDSYHFFDTVRAKLTGMGQHLEGA